MRFSSSLTLSSTLSFFSSCWPCSSTAEIDWQNDWKYSYLFVCGQNEDLGCDVLDWGDDRLYDVEASESDCDVMCDVGLGCGVLDWDDVEDWGCAFWFRSRD